MDKRPFLLDINMPLNRVQRAWVRLPVTLILIPFILIIAIPVGIFEAWKTVFTDFIVPCLEGEQEKRYGCEK